MKQTIAFYAPLKSPFHTVPSGEQRIAQLFWLACEKAGFKPVWADSLRSYDRGDITRQQRLAKVGERKAHRLIQRWQQLPPSQQPVLWLTYHLYHKAPDYIGPMVSQALNIPYVLVEASYAAKQQYGPWAPGLAASVQAIQQASSILSLNPGDIPGLQQVLGDNDRIHLIKPFINPVVINENKSQLRQQLSKQWQLPVTSNWLLTVAMLRPRDKQQSYQYLSQILPQLTDLDWHWVVVGDGKVRTEIQGYFGGLTERTRWVGGLAEQEVTSWLTAADLLIWPAINEALGMVFLEAQAAGLPSVAGAEVGVASLFDQKHPAGVLLATEPPSDFANAIRQLLLDKTAREQLGQRGVQHVAQYHSLQSTSIWLKNHFSSLINK
ncbi:glycosyltransferase family 4 protein [Endozoicomonas sp. SM1973]|uniref:Glycosyltransferase family 4 protein n=1 Tax=Spartinivicinus marinus TaxID=2994442 RepID=A0A853IA25_9GAMM|nr:glycosyltransferase family 4 protein [Spartinivicinus marinus]MCX4029822.1 glycosyltransferase family 4 protein [Spartinivicinus marinus]NYZ67508.1 glycosyltransferase family 4 protein [Spartinivicinus marinus]